MSKEDLAFNGQAGDGVNRASNRHAGNHSGLIAKEHYGNGPRKAVDNSQASMHDDGPSVTKDKYRTAPITASDDGRINGGTTVRKFPRPDAINVGSK
jgi:hypothetical protein